MKTPLVWFGRMTNALATIAIVDDDDSIRYALANLLRAAEFEVVAYASAEAFLEAPDREQSDCLIADINLPGMNGVALVEALAAAGRPMPTVLITARDDPMTLELMRRAKQASHLRKPFREEELFAAIHQVLRN